MAVSRNLDVMIDAFLDGITGAALFGKLRRSGAPEVLADTLSTSDLTICVRQEVTIYRSPEPNGRIPLLIPVNAKIYRWNEIASALGNPGTTAPQGPAASFSLADVEVVVERVLARALRTATGANQR
jgi:hypothetical protein